MKFIKGDTSLRIQLSNTDKGKFTETPYEFISCISNNGTQIIIESNIDPNAQNLTYSYATVTEPVTANINILTEVLSCWVLEKSRLPKNENGDRYIQHFPDVTSTGCWGIISHDACPNVLQAVGNTLYFDGQPLGAGGGGALVSADNGLEVNPSGNVRMGGTLIQDTYTDAQGFEYFMNNFSTWRVQVGAGDPFGAIYLDATRARLSSGTSIELGTARQNAGTAVINQILYLKNASTGEVEYRHPFIRLTALDTTAGPLAVSLNSINALDGETRTVKIIAGANTASVNDTNGKLVEGVLGYVFSTAGASRTFTWSTSNDQWYLTASYL